ncbi:NotI family restriction endonuclease [Marinobacter mangrovi]|uniref:NotI family restriction endonuclease n=1 Tax=Marinobacter mangrovi TaxID=2803918 RepID=UPI00193126C5|nr:NotI family restriction endonuclease [Marinobacter mangrovi]
MTVPAPRWGIAEWYGKDIRRMTAEERRNAALLAIEQEESQTPPTAPVCPHLSTLVPGAKCNKSGGVCSIRKYSIDSDGITKPSEDEKVVTICPLRFLQNIGDNESLFDWIGAKMLDTKNPAIIKETPFLHTISDKAGTENPSQGSTMAGRIDWIVVDPESAESKILNWCAIETQALYFSGQKMKHEFKAYAEHPTDLLYPSAYRRPDYRSSGPKRLGPQLDVKVPVLRNWGNKLAVVIDGYFFEKMNKLEDADPFAKNDEEHRDNADVVWFVVDYDDDLNLVAQNVVFTTLESSRKALSGTAPISKTAFNEGLRELLSNEDRGNKVFLKENSKGTLPNIPSAAKN